MSHFLLFRKYICVYVGGGGSFQNTSYKCFDGTTVFLVLPSGEVRDDWIFDSEGPAV